MSKIKGKHYNYRSAITGCFVSKKYAKRFPKNTVREWVMLYHGKK